MKNRFQFSFQPKQILSLLILIFAIGANAQHKEANNWYFGAYVGMTWNTTQTIGSLTGLPTPLPPSAMTNQQEGVFGMSDSDGNLLFYSDGMKVWNKNHQVMSNGSGLTGDNSSAQSGIVIPYPGQPGKYIAFTIGLNSMNNLSYSVIDMSLNGGLGDVTSLEKNVKLTGAIGVLGESVAAVIHANSTDYWVVAVGKGTLPNSALNVWKVTTAGVQTACYASYTMPATTNAAAGANGYLRFSPNGKYFAWPDYSTNNVFFGTFDPSNGSFSNQKVMNVGFTGYGAEFSTSSEILYLPNSSNRNIYAYKFEDLLVTANPAIYRSVATGATVQTYSIQLGPDGRIYGTVFQQTTMYVIDNVNDYNNFTVHLVNGLLPTGSGYQGRAGLPNYMAHYFAPVDVTCPYFTDDIWYFGLDGGGIAFHEDNTGNKVAVNASGESLVNSNENSLSVSSPGCGSSLIFYAQHNKLYNALHQEMLNGSFTGSTSIADGLGACYIGDNKYMFLSVSHGYEDNPSLAALQYHIIDMNRDGGYGEMISTATIESSGMSESIELTPVPGTFDSYWLIYNMRQANEIRVRKITGNTVSGVVYTLPMNLHVSDGMSYVFKANSQYNRLALAYPSAKKIGIFDFDTNTGMIAVNHIATTSFSDTYGVEFSPNGQYLYCSNWTGTCEMSQYDIAAKTFTTPFPYVSTYGGGLKVGPDGKLYVKRVGQYMGVIDNPDAPLTSSGYVADGFDLGAFCGGLTFSTGLTPPAVCPPGLNEAPVATDDFTDLCVNGYSICVPVLDNDYDPNPGDSILLVNVFFLNEADTTKVHLSFNTGDSTICITSKPAAQEGDIIKLMYTIRDNANPIRLCDDAQLTIRIITCPDNIIDPNCDGAPQAFEWGIKTSWSSALNLSSMAMPMVGDLDGDGIPEIVCFSNLNRTQIPGGVSAPSVNTMVIFDGKTHAIKRQITMPSSISEYDAASYGLVKTSTGKGLIVVATIDLKMRAYDIDGNLVWTTRAGEDYGAVLQDLATTVSFADFNNDGHPEVYVRNKIYDAETGFLLGTASGGSNLGVSWADWTHLKAWKQAAPFAADATGDGQLNLILGNEIYDVQITNRNSSANAITLAKTIAPPAGVPADGHAQVADFNKDGHLDILITNRNVSTTSGTVYMYIWDVFNNTVSNVQAITTNMSGKSIPLIGDINNDGKPEILIQCASSDGYRYRCYKYDSLTRTFSYLWGFAPDEDSFSTTATLFDFNQDGMNEILLADQSNVRILNGSGKSHITGADTTAVYTMAAMAFGYGTCMQYPIIADVDDDGSAELIAIGTAGSASHSTQDGSLNIFKSSTAQPWAPARKVWNQYMYNAVHVNEDLTVPKYQLNPATVFPGADGLFGTADDVRPFNNFLQQPTVLSMDGVPFFLLPDVYTTPALISSTVFGDSVSITVGLINQGDAAIGSPVYVSVYKETMPQVYNSTNRIRIDSANIVILQGNTGTVTVSIPDITPFLPLGNIVIRLNDNGHIFPYQAECDSLNNTLTIVNPAYHLMTKKSATLFMLPSSDFFVHNGTYPNPVATLFGEEIEYRISAVNAFLTPQTIVILDTLPAYLSYKPNSSNVPLIIDPPMPVGIPPRDTLYWSVANVPSLDSAVIIFRASPQDGVSASQPMYINRAWVGINGVKVPTNSTYHQGAGVSLITFSAGYGGRIYNAAEQALDYGTSPRSGVVVVPDEGYRFAGWSHPAYPSLRGATIEAQSGVLYYETLTVYGDMTLLAVFEPEPAPIVALFSEIENAGLNPPADEKTTDRIWAAAGELYVKTSKPGSIVRIYSMEGILLKLQSILKAGETKIKLPAGLYVVTLNNGLGTKIMVND